MCNLQTSTLFTGRGHLSKGDKIPTITTPESNFENSDFKMKLVYHSGNGDHVKSKQNKSHTYEATTKQTNKKLCWPN